MDSMQIWAVMVAGKLSLSKREPTRHLSLLTNDADQCVYAVGEGMEWWPDDEAGIDHLRAPSFFDGPSTKQRRKWQRQGTRWYVSTE